MIQGDVKTSIPTCIVHKCILIVLLRFSFFVVLFVVRRRIMYCMGNVDLSCWPSTIQVSPKTRRAVRSFFLNYLFNCGARQKYEGFRQPSEYFGNCSKYLVNKCSTSRTVYGKPYLVEYHGTTKVLLSTILLIILYSL
jgi:hypothetical protein